MLRIVRKSLHHLPVIEVDVVGGALTIGTPVISGALFIADKFPDSDAPPKASIGSDEVELPSIAAMIDSLLLHLRQ